MKYSGTLTVTPLQQGAVAWVQVAGEPYKSTIHKTYNRVYKDTNNVTQEEISYEVVLFPGKRFKSSEVFSSENALSADFEAKAEAKDI